MKEYVSEFMNQCTKALSGGLSTHPKWDTFASTMRAGSHTILAMYIAAIFLTLPILPPVVTYLNRHAGPGVILLPPALTLLLIGFVLGRHLFVTARPPPPWPHLALLGIFVLCLGAWRYLASSPVGRVHILEYGFLAVLLQRALPGARSLAACGLVVLAAGLIGLFDEGVQLLLPNRVFDWYDVWLNAAAAFLGVLASAWWRWTVPEKTPV